jgi:hypothetical protein
MFTSKGSQIGCTSAAVTVSKIHRSISLLSPGPIESPPKLSLTHVLPYYVPPLSLSLANTCKSDLHALHIMIKLITLSFTSGSSGLGLRGSSDNPWELLIKYNAAGEVT